MTDDTGPADRSAPESLLARVDMTAIADRCDKVRECEFFLDLASRAPERAKFRWLVSAYLNAVYSYFETAAMYASLSITHPATGELRPDEDALAVLRPYVTVAKAREKPDKSGYFVKTTAVRNTLLDRVFKVRNEATHASALSIMATGPNLPEDYHLGIFKGEGVHLLPLCREALTLVRHIQAELEK